MHKQSGNRGPKLLKTLIMLFEGETDFDKIAQAVGISRRSVIVYKATYYKQYCEERGIRFETFKTGPKPGLKEKRAKELRNNPIIRWQDYFNEDGTEKISPPIDPSNKID